MSRKAEVFFDAITLLREDLVEEAQNYVFRKRRSAWKKFGSLAACMVLVVSLGMLAALPRGCGASAPNSSGGDSSSAPAAPAEMPPASTEDAPSGDSSPWADGTYGTSRPPEGEGAPDFGLGDSLTQFKARVLEVSEDGLLAELLPEEGRLFGMDRVRIGTAGLDGLPDLRPGDVVAVSCETLFMGDGEAVAEDVTELRLAEPDGP